MKEFMGKTADGAEVDLYTLTNANGLRVKIMTYGATIISVETPDRNGQVEDITLSLDSLQDYLNGHPCLGSTIGRFANRIAKGHFNIEDKPYTLAVNNGPNHLHGGIRGFDKVVWKAMALTEANSQGVAFSYTSVDGEEGYPGNLIVTVIYRLTDANELQMEYTAVADETTVVNLTNHTYWNLGGGRSGDVLGQELLIHADRYLTTDAGLIPVGEPKGVHGTPLDFTRSKAIGTDIEQAGGYDHCFVLNKAASEKGPTFAARTVDSQSGRIMEVYTTEPGIQLYTANGLNGSLKSKGHAYQRYFGFCLETQHYPDSPNRPDFPSTLLKPGEIYRQLTLHKFRVA